MLAPTAGRAIDIDPEIFRIDLHIDFLCLRKNSNSHCGGMDPALGLCFRDTLDAVDACFTFQTAIHFVSRNKKDHLLEASEP
jgi:hypothetical protein